MSTAVTSRTDRRTQVDTLSGFLWSGVSVCLEGDPGTTKSSTCRAIFKAFDWPQARVGMPSITDPILLVGLPQQDEEATRMKPYPWLLGAIKHNAEKRRNGIVFEDATECPRTVQCAMLDVLGERVIGEYELPYTSMVLTANPVGGGLQITTAMANRIAHLKWSNSPKEQAALMRKDYPLPEIPQFEDNWEDRLPQVRRQIAEFLDTLQDFEAPDQDTAMVTAIVGPYPTGRTWELTARVWAALESSSLTEERCRNAKTVAAKSLVGDVAANAFMMWLQYPDMLKPGDVITNPRLVLGKKELFQADRPDRAYIFLASLIRYIVKSDDVKAWKAGWEVLGHFVDRDCQPICALFAMFLHRRRPEGITAEPPAMKHFQDVLSV